MKPATCSDAAPSSSAVAPRLLSISATPAASTISRPSLRHYVRAAELKAASLDWTEVLAVEPDNPRSRLAAEMLANDDSPLPPARVFIAPATRAARNSKV